MIYLQVKTVEICFMHKENCFNVVTQCTHPSMPDQGILPKNMTQMKKCFSQFHCSNLSNWRNSCKVRPNVPSTLVLLLKNTEMFQDGGYHISAGLRIKRVSEKRKCGIVFPYHILNLNKISLVLISLATLISLTLGLQGGYSFNFHLNKFFKFMSMYIRASPFLFNVDR